MKNRYRNSQSDNDRSRYFENDRYRRFNSYDDEFNNYDDNNYYSNQYNRDYNRPNYNYPMSNSNSYNSYNSDYQSGGRGNQQFGYNNPQPYSSNSYRNRNWENDNWHQKSGNYDNNYNQRNDYNTQDRGWWDKTRDEVSSWFGDDDAERRRRMDEIRDENHRGKGPKNYIRSSDRIKEDVNDKLSDHWMLDASDIEVDVKGNEVILNGTVADKSAKRRAEDIADSVSGVTHVQNNLRVKKAENVSSQDTNTYSTRSRKEVLNHN